MEKRPCIICGEPGRSNRLSTTCARTDCIRDAKRRYDKSRYPEIAEDVRKRASDWYKENTARKSSYDSKYRERNSEKVLRDRRAWTQKRTATRPEYSILASQKRRARKQNNGIYRVTEKDLIKLRHLYRNRCAYCIDGMIEEWDHVIPVSRGGVHSIGNLLPSCSKCNQSKKAATIMEWRLRLLRK